MKSAIHLLASTMLAIVFVFLTTAAAYNISCNPLPMVKQRLGYQFAAEMRLGNEFTSMVIEHRDRVALLDTMLNDEIQDRLEKANVQLENFIDRLNYDRMRHTGDESCKRIHRRVKDACTRVRFNPFKASCRMEIIVDGACIRHRAKDSGQYDKRAYDLVSNWAFFTEPAVCTPPDDIEAFLVDLMLEENNRFESDDEDNESFHVFQEKMNGIKR